jgi:hypothetical protein
MHLMRAHRRNDIFQAFKLENLLYDLNYTAAAGTSNTMTAATCKIEDGRECCHLQV